MTAQPRSTRERIEVRAAGDRVKYIDLERHLDGSVTASAPVADFTVTRFYWHLYDRYTSRLPGLRDIRRSADGLRWIAAIDAPAELGVAR